MTTPLRSHLAIALLVAALNALVITSTVSAVTGVLIARSLGALVLELRQDWAAAALVSQRLLETESEQTRALMRYVAETRRLSGVICAQLTRVDRLHMACP